MGKERLKGDMKYPQNLWTQGLPPPHTVVRWSFQEIIGSWGSHPINGLVHWNSPNWVVCWKMVGPLDGETSLFPASSSISLSPATMRRTASPYSAFLPCCSASPHGHGHGPGQLLTGTFITVSQQWTCPPLGWFPQVFGHRDEILTEAVGKAWC